MYHTGSYTGAVEIFLFAKATVQKKDGKLAVTQHKFHFSINPSVIMVSFSLHRNSSDCSILSSFSANGEKEERKILKATKRTVSFDDASTVVHEFERVADEDRHAVWINQNDYNNTLRSIDYSIRSKKSGCFAETAEQTFLGMECYLKEKTIRRRRRLAVASVLQEQYMQLGNGVNCPEGIAAAYQRALSRKLQHIEIKF